MHIPLVTSGKRKGNSLFPLTIIVCMILCRWVFDSLFAFLFPDILVFVKIEVSNAIHMSHKSCHLRLVSNQNFDKYKVTFKLKLTIMYAKVYISGMEMRQSIFWHQNLLKIMIFFGENGQKTQLFWWTAYKTQF